MYGGLESRLDDLLTELELEYYLAYAGLKESLELSRIYSKYSDLFGADLAREALDLLGRSRDPRDLNLAGHLVLEYLDRLVSDLTDRAVTEEIGTRVEVDGRRYTLRAAMAALSREPDRGLRSRIYRAVVGSIERRINPILEERLGRVHGAARDLGLRCYYLWVYDPRRCRGKALDQMVEGRDYELVRLHELWR